MKYPDAQIYVMLAISVALLGIVVSRFKELKASSVNIVIPTVFVLSSWLHILISFGYSTEEVGMQGMFHFANLILFFASLICIACALRDARAEEKSLNRSPSR